MHIVLNWLVITLVILIVISATKAAWFAWLSARARTTTNTLLPSRSCDALDSRPLPPLSVVIPAFNEEASIVDTVRSAAASNYGGELEIIVVNDGSHDATISALLTEFQLVDVERTANSACRHQPPRRLLGVRLGPVQLLLVDKKNGGKADALNAGINLARGDYICVIDADTLLHPNALLELGRAVVADPSIVAAGGVIGVANGMLAGTRSIAGMWRFKSLLIALQMMEYARAFAVGRPAASRLGLTTLICGAFGIFRRDILLTIGGYRRDTVGEDHELVVRIHRFMLDRGLPYSVRFVPSAVAWTEVPDTLHGLGTQRSRWQRGALQTLLCHFDMLRSPRYGRVGLIGVGSIGLTDLINPFLYLAGIMATIIGCVAGIVGWDLVAGLVIFLAVTGVIADFSAVRSFALSTHADARPIVDIWRFAGLSMADSLFYRHLLLLFCIYGIWQQFRRPNIWGTIERRGFRIRDDRDVADEEHSIPKTTTARAEAGALFERLPSI